MRDSTLYRSHYAVYLPAPGRISEVLFRFFCVRKYEEAYCRAQPVSQIQTAALASRPWKTLNKPQKLPSDRERYVYRTVVALQSATPVAGGRIDERMSAAGAVMIEICPQTAARMTRPQAPVCSYPFDAASATSMRHRLLPSAPFCLQRAQDTMLPSRAHTRVSAIHAQGSYSADGKHPHPLRSQRHRQTRYHCSGFRTQQTHCRQE